MLILILFSLLIKTIVGGLYQLTSINFLDKNVRIKSFKTYVEELLTWFGYDIVEFFNAIKSIQKSPGNRIGNLGAMNTFMNAYKCFYKDMRPVKYNELLSNDFKALMASFCMRTSSKFFNQHFNHLFRLKGGYCNTKTYEENLGKFNQLISEQNLTRDTNYINLVKKYKLNIKTSLQILNQHFELVDNLTKKIENEQYQIGYSHCKSINNLTDSTDFLNSHWLEFNEFNELLRNLDQDQPEPNFVLNVANLTPSSTEKDFSEASDKSINLCMEAFKKTSISADSKVQLTRSGYHFPKPLIEQNEQSFLPKRQCDSERNTMRRSVNACNLFGLNPKHLQSLNHDQNKGQSYNRRLLSLDLKHSNSQNDLNANQLNDLPTYEQLPKSVQQKSQDLPNLPNSNAPSNAFSQPPVRFADNNFGQVLQQNQQPTYFNQSSQPNQQRPTFFPQPYLNLQTPYGNPFVPNQLDYQLFYLPNQQYAFNDIDMSHGQSNNLHSNPFETNFKLTDTFNKQSDE